MKSEVINIFSLGMKVNQSRIVIKLVSFLFSKITIKRAIFNAIVTIFLTQTNSEIVVRIGTIEEPRQFGEGKFFIFKFIVETEKSLRIQCIAMEDQIDRIRPLVKKNTIIRIKGAMSKNEKNPKYNTGDVPFVLMIYANTTITVIKDYEPDDESEENSTYGIINDSTTSTLSALASHYELENITMAINENTAALKELTAVLRNNRNL